MNKLWNASRFVRMNIDDIVDNEEIDINELEMPEKWILNKLESDACLIAFFAEGYDDWRFSFVNIDYKREKTKAGKIKAVENLTPLKRFSFLVGKNEAPLREGHF